MAHLYKDTGVKSLYTDRKFMGGKEGWQDALEESCTLYIGNLSFYTTEEQLYELFSRCGELKRVVMGLDRNSKTPCGFCFVEFHHREATEDAVRMLSGCKLDERMIRVGARAAAPPSASASPSPPQPTTVAAAHPPPPPLHGADWDGGFVEGRQYGRGRSGGQVRDEYRADYDAGRGGWGKALEQPAALPPPRRRSFEPRGPRFSSGGGGGGGPQLPPISQGGDEPSAKRAKAEEPVANPRFREDKEDDEDDED